MTPSLDGPKAAAGLGRRDERELAVRIARKDGRQVVSLRAAERADGCVVACDVYPVASLAVDPVTPGPYHFPDAGEALRFVEEAVQALVYLGCDVHSQ